MVDANGMTFVNKISFRNAGESAKIWLERPAAQELDAYLSAVENGQVECLTLYGPNEERLFIIGKPGFYHITIFVNESGGYGYNDGTKDMSNIDIAGDYWPSFRVCKNMGVLKSIAHEFFNSGKPADSDHWLHFSDEA